LILKRHSRDAIVVNITRNDKQLRD
jgi:hypothetical protein